LTVLLVSAITAAMLGRAAPAHTPRESVEDLLVHRLRRGDARALGEAYDAHHEALRAFARRLLGDAAAAEDTVHEVFVSLPSAIRRFEGRSSLRTFLLSIAVNHTRHAKRATARRLGAYERMHLEPRHDEGTNPEREHERRALADMLDRMLDALPMDQRVAVVLCIVEERTAGDAAQIAGVPEATMRTRLFYARRKLREMLDVEMASVEVAR
jgi:RNA polymerase sigma-70 factor (ECF subfamily)